MTKDCELIFSNGKTHEFSSDKIGEAIEYALNKENEVYYIKYKNAGIQVGISPDEYDFWTRI